MNASTESLSLGWISLDLDRHIETAKNAFESYLSSDEEKTGSGKLEAALQHTQNCVSTFQQAELLTAAILTDEIVDVLRQLVDDQVRNKDEAYQVVIGGFNQLLNYLARLKRSGSDEPAMVLAVINDIRTVSGKSLLLPVEQFQPGGEYEQRGAKDNNSLVKELACCDQLVLGQLSEEVARNLQAVSEKPEEQRGALLAAKRALICTDWKKIGLDKDSLLADLLLASEAIVGGALRQGNKLPIAARHTISRVFIAMNAAPGEGKASVDFQQLRNELLFCLCLTADASDSASYLFAKYELDQAIRIANRSELLHLGTPDCESITIVLDSLAEDIAVLQNGLQGCAEAGGALEESGDLLAMAANLQYTLQLVQFHEAANQLEGVVEQLGAAQRAGNLDATRLEAIAGRLFEVEAALQKIRVGSGRDISEINVIEQLQASCEQVRELTERIASLDLESARKLISDAQIATEMNSALEPAAEQLTQICGAARFIRSEQLVDVVQSMKNYYESSVAAPLEKNEVAEVEKSCHKFSSAIAALEHYLGALKESNHALVDNLLLKVGECIDIAPAQAIVEMQPKMEDALTEANEAATEIEGATSVAAVTGNEELPLEGEFDDEIVEIFLEEAEEVFETLNENYALLKEDDANEAALAEVRRGYHTLKGSGRMAGAEDVGNAAWAVENLLNCIIDKTINLSTQRLELLGEANDYLPILIQYFSRRVQPFSPALESLIQRVETSASAEDACVETGISIQLEASKNDCSAAPRPIVETDNIVSFEEEQPTDTVAEMAIESEEPTVDFSTAEELTALPGIDEVEQAEPELSDEERELTSLREIFMEESAAQLLDLEAYLASGPTQLPDEPVERALHTLAGGARIAGLGDFADLASPAEKLVGHIRREGSITTEQYELLEAVALQARQFVNGEAGAAISESDQFNNLVQALLEELASTSQDESDTAASAIAELSNHCSLVFDASNFLKAWRVSATPPPEFQAMLAEIAQISADSQHESAITRLCESLSSAHKCFAEHGLHQQAYQALQSGHAELVDMLDAMAAGLPLSDNVAAELDLLVAEEQEVAQLAAAQIVQRDKATSESAGQLDREIVNIFLEESVDLVEEVETAVTAWADDTKNSDYLEVLLRPLHTLKGGARMAGLDAVGTLCHEFETLLQAVKNGEKKADPQFFKNIQSYLADLGSRFNEVADAPAAVSEAAEKANDKSDKRVAELVRVPSDLLDGLVNLAGETSIARSLVEEKLADFGHSIDEIDATVERLKEQLRRLEIETEAQIAFRREKVEIEGQEEFDPLEMDRYSQLQQLSKSLVESASDLKDLKSTLRDKTRDVETLLLQQSRINTELQEGLMRTRTVPLSRTIVPRLRKTVRQVSGELDKPVTFEVGSSDGELDKSVIERMVAPLEHVLRNAIDHGIESADVRKKAGKPSSGAIEMTINREGSDVVLRISDDGKGIDAEAVRTKAIEQGLVQPDQTLSDEALQQLIFSPGFSTAHSVTQISGRGVGMDVVRSEIQELGGTIEMQSIAGKGTMFVIRLPFTMSMNRALLVSAGGESIAIPLDTIEGIVRVSPFELEEYYGEQAVEFMYAGQQYDFRYLGAVLNGSEPQYSTDMVGALPVLLVRANAQLIAYQVDRLLGSREIVVKSLGPQFNELSGIIGATVLGDGSVVMIADLGAISASQKAEQSSGAALPEAPAVPIARDRMVAMVVDDSVTVRKVTTRLLEREGFDVVTAKDGLDAMEKLEELKPDVMLLDIEMPRLDGFEVVSRVRHDTRLEDMPIIMITSRTGDKHRERALSLGANEFLGKPYQDHLLMEKIALVAPGLCEQGSSAQTG